MVFSLVKQMHHFYAQVTQKRRNSETNLKKSETFENEKTLQISHLQGFKESLKKTQRRKRDSNPRRCDPRWFSRPVHSTALPSLLKRSQK